MGRAEMPFLIGAFYSLSFQVKMNCEIANNSYYIFF